MLLIKHLQKALYISNMWWGNGMHVFKNLLEVCLSICSSTFANNFFLTLIICTLGSEALATTNGGTFVCSLFVVRSMIY
jgi:hypothetical protein